MKWKTEWKKGPGPEVKLEMEPKMEPKMKPEPEMELEVHLKYEETERDRRRMLRYGAFHAAWILAQVLFLVLVIVYIVLAELDLASLTFEQVLAVVLGSCAAAFLLMAYAYYSKAVKRDVVLKRLLRDGPLSVTCEISERCAVFLAAGMEPVTAWFHEVERITVRRRNIIFCVDRGGRAFFLMIPAAAFESPEQFRSVRSRLKKVVRQQQRPGARHTVVGSFLRGAGRGLLGYLGSCLKLFVFVAIAWFALLLIMQVAVIIKGAG